MLLDDKIEKNQTLVRAWLRNDVWTSCSLCCGSLAKHLHCSVHVKRLNRSALGKITAGLVLN